MSNTDAPARAHVEMSTIHWQLRHNGGTTDIATEAYDNSRLIEAGDNSAVPNLLLIPGYGERRWSTERTLEQLAQLGRPAMAVLFDSTQVDADMPSVLALATEFVPQVTQILQEEKKLTAKASAIGHSMGGGVLGLGLAESGDMIGTTVFCQSIGLDNPARQIAVPEENKRQAAFTNRFVQVLAKAKGSSSPSDRLSAAKDILSELYKDYRHGHGFQIKAKISTQNDNFTNVINHAQSGNQVLINTGGKDPIVRPAEVYLSYMLTMGLRNDLTDQQEVSKITKNLFWDNQEGLGHTYLGWRAGNMMIKRLVTVMNTMQTVVQKTVQNTNTK